MRNIKFRAWVFSEKQMLTNGDWFCLDLTFPTPYIQYADQGYYINNENADKITKEQLISKGIEPKDDFVLMQYTNSNDKNEKDIYDGDIIEYEDGLIGYVSFIQQELSWCVTFVDNSIRPLRRLYFENDAIIIGNIYENENLLSKK